MAKLLKTKDKENILKLARAKKEIPILLLAFSLFYNPFKKYKSHSYLWGHTKRGHGLDLACWP